MEILLVRFTKEQRAWIRKQVRMRKAKSEAEAVREAVMMNMRHQSYKETFKK